MNPENLPLIIVLLCGISIGTVAGILVAGAFAQAKMRRAERQAWLEAEAFFNRVRHEQEHG